jgi:hypothetical protein
VTAANNAGGRDNVTVIVGRIADPKRGGADTTAGTADRTSSAGREGGGQARTGGDLGPTSAIQGDRAIPSS